MATNWFVVSQTTGAPGLPGSTPAARAASSDATPKCLLNTTQAHTDPYIASCNRRLGAYAAAAAAGAAAGDSGIADVAEVVVIVAADDDDDDDDAPPPTAPGGNDDDDDDGRRTSSRWTTPDQTFRLPVLESTTNALTLMPRPTDGDGNSRGRLASPFPSTSSNVTDACVPTWPWPR
jgi:hypothetical protein